MVRERRRSRMTNQCHDITVFPEVGLAAGACSGNGILMDISDPVNPVRLDHVTDKNFAYWHSATFNIDGTKVVFTDEWGGGTRPRCRATDPPTWGGDAIFDIVDRKLKFASYYKMPAPQTEQENCVAHNGSLIPVPGRDIMVQGWYQGGISVFDFTDSAKPVEIAFFDRGPIDAKQLITGGYWSAYWYNGHIYGSEIARGVDVFRLHAERAPDAERDRRRDDGAGERAQRAAADEDRLAGERRRGARVSRSADPRQRDSAGARPRREDRARRCRRRSDGEGKGRCRGSRQTGGAGDSARGGCRRGKRARRGSPAIAGVHDQRHDGEAALMTAMSGLVIRGCAIGLAFLAVSPLLAAQGSQVQGRIVEIRSYNLKPGTRDTFHQLAERDAIPMLKRWKIDVVAYGPSLHDANSYFLIRSFDSIEARQRSEDAFYGSDEWIKGPRQAVLACIESYTTVVVPLDRATLDGLRKDTRALPHSRPRLSRRPSFPTA